jgi:hypothetical protein
MADLVALTGDPAPRPSRVPDASWAALGFRARAWRVVHAVWSVAQLTALATIYRAVARGQRSPRVWASASFLALEGAGLLIGRGDCPMGRMQEQWGDPKPFFELILPPPAAKAAVPVLAVVASGGLLGLVACRPGLRWRAPGSPASGSPPEAS